MGKAYSHETPIIVSAPPSMHTKMETSGWQSAWLLLAVLIIFMFLNIIIVYYLNKRTEARCEQLIIDQDFCADRGERGLQGPRGTPGLPGICGPNGENGKCGSQGRPGHAGPQGVQGTQGTQGEHGQIGISGLQGPTGSLGLPGIDGALGATGPQGPVGATGEIGSSAVLWFSGKGSMEMRASQVFVLGPVTNMDEVVFFDAGDTLIASPYMAYLRLPRSGILGKMYFSVQLLAPFYTLALSDITATVYVAASLSTSDTPIFNLTAITATVSMTNTQTFGSASSTLQGTEVNAGEYVSLVISTSTPELITTLINIQVGLEFL